MHEIEREDCWMSNGSHIRYAYRAPVGLHLSQKGMQAVLDKQMTAQYKIFIKLSVSWKHLFTARIQTKHANDNLIFLR